MRNMRNPSIARRVQRTLCRSDTGVGTAARHSTERAYAGGKRYDEDRHAEPPRDGERSAFGQSTGTEYPRHRPSDRRIHEPRDGGSDGGGADRIRRRSSGGEEADRRIDQVGADGGARIPEAKCRDASEGQKIKGDNRRGAQSDNLELMRESFGLIEMRVAA